MVRVDLVTGRASAPADFPGVSDVVAASPDGLRILMLDAKDRHARRRLHARRPQARRRLASVRQGTRCGTRSGLGRFPRRRSRPDGQQVGDARALVDPQVQGYLRARRRGKKPCCDPGRKTLAAFSGGTVRIHDTTTGTLKGEADSPSILATGKLDLTGAAFSADGTGLAAYFNDAQLAQWDIKTGKAVTGFPAPLAPNPMQRNGVLEWCGPKHVLLHGRMLIDIEHRVHVWSYDGGSIGGGGPDGRHRFVGGMFNQPAVLIAASLPEPTVPRVVAMADGAKVAAVLRVGQRVGLQLEFGGPRNAEGFRTAVRQAIETKLATYQMTIADGSPVRPGRPRRGQDDGPDPRAPEDVPQLPRQRSVHPIDPNA